MVFITIMSKLFGELHHSPFMCARMNREAKQTLELDWSDKYQAYSFDDHGGRHCNTSPDTQQHPSSATMQEQ